MRQINPESEEDVNKGEYGGNCQMSMNRRQLQLCLVFSCSKNPSPKDGAATPGTPKVSRS